MNADQRKIIGELYHSLFNFLFSYALGSLKSASLAEEAVQETFAIACQKPDSLCNCPSQKGWLINTLKNVIHNIEKRRAVASKVIADCLNVPIDSLPAPPDQIDLKLQYEDLANTEEFKLMLAISQEGKSLIELAKERNISVDACKKRAQRAREFLQKRIK